MCAGWNTSLQAQSHFQLSALLPRWPVIFRAPMQAVTPWMNPFCVFVWVFALPFQQYEYSSAATLMLLIPIFVSRRLRISIKVSQWVPFGFLMHPLRIMDMPIRLTLRPKQQTANRGDPLRFTAWMMTPNPPTPLPPHPYCQYLSHTHKLTHLPPTTTHDSRANWLVEKSAISKELWVASRQQINGPLFIVFSCRVHSRVKLLKRHKQNQTKQWGLVAWFSYCYCIQSFILQCSLP